MAKSKPIPKHLQATEAEKALWLRRHYGIQTIIANGLNPPASQQFVCQVFWGVRTSRRVSAAIDAVFTNGKKRQG